MKTCKICNKQFVRPRNLRRHQEEVHHKIKWKCQVCSKEFGRAESLKRHQASHERNDMHLLGDRFTTQRFLLAAGKVGDILPWSSSENVMLIAPSAVCGITIPRSWSRAMACRVTACHPWISPSGRGWDCSYCPACSHRVDSTHRSYSGRSGEYGWRFRGAGCERRRGLSSSWGRGKPARRGISGVRG